MIAIGCDHGGYSLKLKVMEWLDSQGIAYKDFGTYGPESTDYAKYAYLVCQAIVNGEAEKGILICGTGIGMSMAANKVKGIRAAVCGDYFSAKATRAHNDANVICIGERVTGPGLTIELIDIFLKTEFEGGRHQRRVDQIAAIENGTFED